jgi:hypothetical protein
MVRVGGTKEAEREGGSTKAKYNNLLQHTEHIV